MEIIKDLILLASGACVLGPVSKHGISNSTK